MRTIRQITTEFLMSYPAVSVYEFEFLKEERDVIEFWEKSSIYLICQRPVLYFDEVVPENGCISMLLKQRGQASKLKILLPIHGSKNLAGCNKEIYLDIQFYESEPTNGPPFNNVAGIRLLDKEKNFIFWLTPERLLFLYIKCKINCDIQGNIHDFLTYIVHYIGQAQKQNIAKRLTGHEKLSKALILEHPFIKGEFSPFELSLIFLHLENYEETSVIATPKFEDIFLGGDDLKNEDLLSLAKPKYSEVMKEYIINDFEAYLVNFFQPKYNEVKYENYPNIKSGLKSIGFHRTQHKFLLFAGLKTDEATSVIEIKPI